MIESALAVAQAKYWHLKQIDLFHGLADWKVRQLSKIADLRLYKRGEHLFASGDLSDTLFVLRSGKVKSYRRSAEGRELILSFHGAGEIVGERAVTGEPCREGSAEVVEDAFVCIIDAEYLRDHFGDHPELALQLAAILARRKSAVEVRMLELLTNDVTTRVGHALADLARNHGCVEDDGIRIDLPLTQTDLAQLVGSTRETTSMAFNTFRRNGWVDTRDRTLWVLDPESLAGL